MPEANDTNLCNMPKENDAYINKRIDEKVPRLIDTLAREPETSGKE